jgi:hypothetical protein
VRNEKQDELDASYTRVIHKAQEALIDRLEHGDEVITRTGERMRKAVTAKDLATIGGIQFDKRQIARNLPTSISNATDNKALADLKAQFEALAAREAKVINSVEYDKTMIEESDTQERPSNTGT